MGLFNFFNKKNSKTIKKTSNFKNIEELFNTSPSERNESWINEFNNSLKNYTFERVNQNIFEDKAGMNYVNLKLSNQGKKIDEFIDVCLKNGWGISINGNEENYDWLFTYGELTDFFLNNKFYSNQISEPFVGNVVDRYLLNKQVTIGQPSEKYLPQITRLQIKNLLKSFGLENIQMALIWWRENNRLTLAFEIVPEMFQDATDESLEPLLKFIGWFLPNHYDVIFIKGNEDFELLS